MGEVSSTAVRGAGSSRAAREKANPRSRVRGGESRAADARASSSPFALGEASRTRSATRESAPRRGKRLDPKRGSGPTAYLKSTVRRPALLDGTPTNLFPATFQEPFACRHRPRETRAIRRRETTTDGANLPTVARTTEPRDRSAWQRVGEMAPGGLAIPHLGAGHFPELPN